MATQIRKINAKNSTAKNLGTKFCFPLEKYPPVESMKAYFSKVKKSEFIYKDAQEPLS
ncbi:MAG TPA: hypothetical protein VK021_07380 [Flavobacteriaceae bacterium]|nr:hypothetical protein [Flavobacteriaceae bacterium]